MQCVSERSVAREREEAIIRLMDDDSPVVQAALIEELRRLDGAGIALLKRVVRSGNRILGCQARDYLMELEGPDTVAEFVNFIRSLNYELETGCILLFASATCETNWRIPLALFFPNCLWA